MSEIILSLEARIEALLFVLAEEITIKRLSDSLQADVETIREAGDRLAATLSGRGIRLQRQNDAWQLVTAPEAAPDVERFLGEEMETGKLSRAALETLAIIAYRQPVTRAQIAAVRGVSSDGVLRNLVNMGLVEEVGRRESPGRPILYGTTTTFLQHFGLESLAQLPDLDADKTRVMADSLEGALRDKNTSGEPEQSQR